MLDFLFWFQFSLNISLEPIGVGFIYMLKLNNAEFSKEVDRLLCLLQVSEEVRKHVELLRGFFSFLESCLNIIEPY